MFDQELRTGMNRNQTTFAPKIVKYESLKKQFASADPEADADLGSIMLAEQVVKN